MLVTLYKGTQLAKASPVEGLMVAPVGESIPSSRKDAPDVSPRKSIMLQEMVERSASDFTPDEKEMLYLLLLQCADVFAE